MHAQANHYSHFDSRILIWKASKQAWISKREQTKQNISIGHYVALLPKAGQEFTLIKKISNISKLTWATNICSKVYYTQSICIVCPNRKLREDSLITVSGFGCVFACLFGCTVSTLKNAPKIYVLLTSFEEFSFLKTAFTRNPYILREWPRMLRMTVPILSLFTVGNEL